MEIICEPFWTKQENFIEYAYFDGVGVRPVNRDDFWWGIYVVNNILDGHIIVSGCLKENTLVEKSITSDKYQYY